MRRLIPSPLSFNDFEIHFGDNTKNGRDPFSSKHVIFIEMKTTTEIRIFELLQNAFAKEQSEELVAEIKSLANDDMLNRVDDKISTAKSEIISALTWRLLFFFIAQVSFTIGIIKLLN